MRPSNLVDDPFNVDSDRTHKRDDLFAQPASGSNAYAGTQQLFEQHTEESKIDQRPLGSLDGLAFSDPYAGIQSDHSSSGDEGF